MVPTSMGQKAHSSKMPTSHLRDRTGQVVDKTVTYIWFGTFFTEDISYVNVMLWKTTSHYHVISTVTRLWAGPNGFWIPAGEQGPSSIIFNGCQGLFPGGKAARTWGWPLTSNWWQGYEWAQLYLHSHPLYAFMAYIGTSFSCENQLYEHPKYKFAYM